MLDHPAVAVRPDGNLSEDGGFFESSLVLRECIAPRNAEMLCVRARIRPNNNQRSAARSNQKVAVHCGAFGFVGWLER